MVTRNDLIEKVARSSEVQLSISKTTAVIEKFFQLIQESLMIGEPVHIKNFGTFSLIERKAQLVTDFNTNKKVLCPAHKEPFFKPNVFFKKAVK